MVPETNVRYDPPACVSPAHVVAQGGSASVRDRRGLVVRPPKAQKIAE